MQNLSAKVYSNFYYTDVVVTVARVHFYCYFVDILLLLTRFFCRCSHRLVHIDVVIQRTHIFSIFVHLFQCFNLSFLFIFFAIFCFELKKKVKRTLLLLLSILVAVTFSLCSTLGKWMCTRTQLNVNEATKQMNSNRHSHTMTEYSGEHTREPKNRKKHF